MCGNDLEETAMKIVEQLLGAYPRFKGNPEHLQKLREGVEAWNAWRQYDKAEIQNISRRGPFSRDIREAMRQGDFFKEANLEGAELFGIKLEGVNLRKANLKGVSFREAQLKGADLFGANLAGIDLAGADLSDADLRVKSPEFFCLNDTKILHARFAPGSSDPWSVVRRTYSGPALLFHLLFLLAFLLPYGIRAGYWKGINAAQGSALVAQDNADRLRKQSLARLDELSNDPEAWEQLEAEWKARGLDVEESREILRAALQRHRERVLMGEAVQTLMPLEAMGLCLRPLKECGSPEPIWRPLLGLHQKEAPWLLRFLALTLIAYNVFRGALTFHVSRLREAEIRSGYYSPRLRDYIWVYWLHIYFMQYIPIAGLFAGGLQLLEWLLVTDVVLPVS